MSDPAVLPIPEINALAGATDDERRQYYLALAAQLLQGLRDRRFGGRGPAQLPLPDPSTSLAQLERVQATSRAVLQSLTQRMIEGHLPIPDWQAQMSKEVRLLLATSAAIARGGLAGVTPDDTLLVQRAAAIQDDYLGRWARSIADPTPTPLAFALTRAGMYAGSATSVFYQIQTLAMGLPDLPRYPGDGSTECLTYCKCRLRIDQLEGDRNYDVYWLIDIVAEHCPDCIALGTSWSPFRIRNGLYA